MRCWCGYLSAAKCRLFAYGPADAIASPNHIISCLIKYRLVLLFWYRLIQVVLENRPLNGCSRLSVWLPRTSQMTVAFCRTLAVAHCGPIPMTCGNCLCHEDITNSVIGVSRPPVLDYGTTFHLDSGGRDLASTLLDNL